MRNFILLQILGRFIKEDQNEMLSNSSNFQDLSASFLNQQISQVLPDISGNTVINIS